MDRDAGEFAWLPWERGHAEERPVAEEEPSLDQIVAIGFLSGANGFNCSAVVGRAWHDFFDATVTEGCACACEAVLHASIRVVADENRDTTLGGELLEECFGGEAPGFDFVGNVGGERVDVVDLVFEKDDFLFLFEGKFNRGAQRFGVAWADDKAVGILDKEGGEGGGLAASLLDVGREDEELDINGVLLAQLTGRVLRAEVGGLVNGIPLVAPDDTDTILPEDFTVLRVVPSAEMSSATAERITLK